MGRKRSAGVRSSSSSEFRGIDGVPRRSNVTKFVRCELSMMMFLLIAALDSEHHQCRPMCDQACSKQHQIIVHVNPLTPTVAIWVQL